MYMRDLLYNLATDKYQGIMLVPIKSFLLALSWAYGLIVRIMILFYSINPYRLKCKVISIGNITLGGTGKTSLVEFVASHLKGQGRKIAILSRGYKRTYATMGDEPYMLSKNLGDIPVVVGKDRIRTAKLAINNYGVDTVILDDAFQQWRIKKDLEIVTIDATDPLGNRELLPRGILREPLSSLKRADIFILAKTNLNPDIGDIRDFLSALNPKAAIFESMHQPLGFYKIDSPDELLNTEIFIGKQVALISGIGDPDSFENLIISLGINIGLSFRFPDHHNYTRKDLEKIIQACRDKNISTIITTEKDAARLLNRQLLVVPAVGGSATHCGGSSHLYVLQIKLEIREAEKFYARLRSLYSD